MDLPYPPSQKSAIFIFHGGRKRICGRPLRQVNCGRPKVERLKSPPTAQRVTSQAADAGWLQKRIHCGRPTSNSTSTFDAPRPHHPPPSPYPLQGMSAIHTAGSVAAGRLLTRGKSILHRTNHVLYPQTASITCKVRQDTAPHVTIAHQLWQAVFSLGPSIRDGNLILRPCTVCPPTSMERPIRGHATHTGNSKKRANTNTACCK